MFPASERNLTLFAGAPGGGGLAVREAMTCHFISTSWLDLVVQL